MALLYSSQASLPSSLSSSLLVLLPDGIFKHDVPEKAREQFGDGLCNLLSHCLDFELEMRLLLRMLQGQIAKSIDRDPYMKIANAEGKNWRDDQNLLRYNVIEHGYRLGVTYNL